MIKKLHFVGIGGSGMSGVASLATSFGYEVTGCDLEASTAYGKNIFQGHDKSHIRNADLVVVSPAVLYQNSENPEILEAKKQNKLMTWQEFLGKVLLKDKKVICIAGTHGKSTTTAMAGKLLIDNGFDPIVVVGANVPEWGGNSRFGKGDYAVVEADEFNNNFLNYSPEVAVINNIEFDHPDFFKNEQEVKDSFEKFIKRLVGKKILITEKDSLNKKFDLKIFGEHNQKNANMVFVLGKVLGIDEGKIIKSIESFNGIGRRMELIADRGGIKVYDDYAHHPTAIKTTLEGLRKEYPKARILAVIEPHGYKRTKALLSMYNGVFDSIDKVIIGPIFQARDQIDNSITSQKVAEISGHKDISYVNSLEEIIEKWQMVNDKYNIVVVMGAGKSYVWARKIANLIQVSFSDLTTFRIGGKIKKYFEAKNKEDIKDVIGFAKQNKLDIFIIGGGSDILVSDKDFTGLVIKYVGKNISFNDNGTVISEAGAKDRKSVV
jgi:UDP-N-acetylmuramate--alanine ligase